MRTTTEPEEGLAPEESDDGTTTRSSNLTKAMEPEEGLAT
jgi:hypothetical protein